MSIEYHENTGISKQKLDRFAAFEMPDVTPETMQYHIANGHRLRAEEIHGLGRKAFGGVARACRRAGRVVTDWARKGRTGPPGDQILR